MKVEKNKLFIFITFLTLSFRTSLSLISASLSFIPLLFGILITIRNFINSGIKQIKKPTIFLFCLIIYFIFLIFLSPLLTVQSGSFIPFLGSFQYLFPIFFWYSFLILNPEKSTEYFRYFIKIFCSIGLLIAIFAYVQYFISPNIFGLISNDVYAPLSGEMNPNVTKRAISFISSPQSLGLFLASVASAHFYFMRGSALNYLKIIIIFGAGILTGSKAFVIFLIVFFMINFSRYFFRLLLSLIALSIAGYLFLPYVDFDTIERFSFIATRLIFISEYNTYQIWLSFLTYPTDIFQLFFGHGLGVMGTASQTIYDYKILNGSTESFLIQLYFEAGIFLMLGFLVFFSWCVFKCYKSNELKPLGSILIASFFVIISTPAFYGFLNSFWLWAILLYVAGWKKI
tara:strand:- start:244 stop:1443 length:1200 start_codon:yes stop_codon:yes gene_type:complete